MSSVSVKNQKTVFIFSATPFKKYFKSGSKEMQIFVLKPVQT